MTIIVFLIDTSASMLQRTYIGGRTTLLDVAKSAVETFVKIRQRSMDSRIDRYMLLTFEETPNNIKAGWKENLATFMNELKNLQCYSMTTMGVAVKQSFDILNINRMTSGIDTYGQGRCPFFLETSVIVLITDGGKLTTVNGVHEDFTLPMHSPVPGSEMTREPFRWDQRLFALVLRLAGTPAADRDTGLVPSDTSPIDAMCEVTGGRSYCITSHRMLNQCIDSLVQKVQNGVVINFEKIGPDPPPPLFDKNDEIKDDLLNGNGNGGGVKEGEFDDRMGGNGNSILSSASWHNCRKMIYVPKSNKSFCVVQGFWPIPESFWPEVTASVLPPRSAHPNIKFTCTSSEPLVIENLPFDKYELEPSPLTQFILSRKQPKTCWQVFVSNSYKNSEVGHPFGYLKASTTLSCVNLFVMPYNYPILLPLLEELAKLHRWKPPNEWRTQFQNYMRTLPAYYAGSLRRALTRMGTPTPLALALIPENSENLSFSVSNYLKRLKNQAKVEYEKLCTDITLRQNLNNLNAMKSSSAEQVRVVPKVTLKKDLISHPLIAEKFRGDQALEGATSNTSNFIVALDKERQTVSFKNPFDIPRNRLVEQVVRMRNNFLQPDWISLDQDSAHSLPISQMGNYQEYLKRQTPQLREIESAPVRQHMFGNPFKIDKRMMVDEADIDLVGSSSSPGGGIGRSTKRPVSSEMGGRLPVKRKRGPLPKGFKFRKTDFGASPTPASPLSPSPVPWLHALEELPSFDERSPLVLPVNGLDSPGSSVRSRSPSPPLDFPSFIADFSATPPPVALTNSSGSSSNNTRTGSKVFNNNNSYPSNINNIINNSSGNSFAPPTNQNHAPPDPVSSSTNNSNLNNTIGSDVSSPSVVPEDSTKYQQQQQSQSISQILKDVSSLNHNNGSSGSISVNHTSPEVKSTPPSTPKISSPTTVQITLEERLEIENQNNEIRKHLHRLVRRPGKNFTELFDNIRTLKGNTQMQVAMVELIIKESLRFKREQLANLLQEYIQSLQSVENK